MKVWKAKDEAEPRGQGDKSLRMPEAKAGASEARDGAAAFTECYQAHYRAIRHFSARLLNDGSEAEELVQ